MEILFLEAYDAGSHRAFREGLVRHSRHRYTCLTLPGRRWLARSRGAAWTLARQALALGRTPDLILAATPLNLALFLALTRRPFGSVPAVLYAHETQLTYPLPPGSRRPWDAVLADVHGALAADRVLFNSSFHRRRWLEALERLEGDLGREGWRQELEAKSQVLPVGIDLEELDRLRPAREGAGPPLILWVHRWEWDKAPDVALEALTALAEAGRPFRVAFLGDRLPADPPGLAPFRRRFPDRVVHAGYAPRDAYVRWLWQGDLVISSARHENFGVAVAEAMACGALPILPADQNYPDLIPPAWHDRLLYPPGAEGLIRALARALENLETWKGQATPRRWVEPFDWRRLAPRYDRLFEALGRSAS